MGTSFLTASEYLANAQKLRVGDATIGEQPSSIPPFHFGRQPQGLKGADNVSGKRRKVLVIGTGDVWNKFSRWAREHRDTECYFFDPDLLRDDDPARVENSRTAEQKRQDAGVDVNHCLPADPSGKLPDPTAIPSDIDSVHIETAPELHKQYILWAQERGLPALVEKPLVANARDFVELDPALSNAKAPVYCMDWMAAHALPLAAILGKAAGVNIPFSDAVHYENEERFKDFDFSHIKSIECRMVEESKGYGDMKHVKAKRPTIYKQGALKDMGVHPMATLANMGIMPGEVTKTILGSTDGQEQDGVYRKIGNGEDTPAWYARAEMTSHFNGQTIPTTIEAAKGGVNDSSITLTDANGHVIRWEFGHEKSKATLLLKGQDKPAATAESEIDPYAMMLEQGHRFLDAQRMAGTNQALYYNEQRAILRAIEAMETMGRSVSIQPGEKVSQLALEPNPRVDLAQATVVGQGNLIQQK